MKKIFILLMLAILVVSMAPAILAEETATGNESVNATGNESVSVTTDDEAEVRIMTTPHGAEVRLDQLKLSIQRNIEQGNEVIAEGNFTNETVANLTSILNDAELLIVDIDALDLNQSYSVLAEEYVAIKKQAIDLSFEFKTIVHKELSEERINAMRERVNERVQERVKGLREQAIQRKEAYQLEQAKMIAKRVGLELNEDEEYTYKQLREMIQEKVKEMPQKRKEEATKRYIEYQAKQRVKYQAIKEDVREQAVQRYKERKADYEEQLQERIQERMSELSEEQQERLQQRLKDGAMIREQLRKQMYVGSNNGSDNESNQDGDE